MMKRKSFVLTIISLFWVGYILLSITQTVYEDMSYKKQAEAFRIKQIDHLLSVAQTLVMTGNVEALKFHLDEASELNLINFYCVKNKDQILYEFSVNTNSGCAMTHDRRIASYGDTLQYTNQIVKPIKVENHLVSVGFATDFWTFFWEGQKSNIYIFIKDVLIITTFLGLLVYLIMKDFLTLDQFLQKGNKAGLSKMKARSKEAQTLIDSTQTLNQMNSDKSDKIHHLQNTVGLAVHSEIDKKTPHLTQIPSSVVRIDLNGYTQIFLEKKEEHIVTVLNEYFSVTNDLIKRFDGEIYQIIGDEIIFVFKNKDPRNALFCVRAVFEWAQELDRKIYDEFKHRFLLKASISHGFLRFVQLNNGYAFAGVPLIESVRLLGCVSDKSENTLILQKPDSNLINPFLKKTITKNVDLKGFEDKSDILEIKDFISLDDFFRNAMALTDEKNQKATFRSLEYFRGQQDILTALNILDKALLNQKWNESFYIIEHLKELKLGIKHPGITQKLYQILSDHFSIITSRSREYPFLNSMILIVESLVHPEMWSDLWAALIKNYLLCSNARIVANSTEVLCHFGFDSSEMQSILLNWKDNNRISANFLLAEMKKSILKVNVKTLLSWLDSDNVLFQASGLYVIEETMRYYKFNDPIVFKTNSSLTHCVSVAKNIKTTNNELIRTRLDRLLSVLTEYSNESAKLSA